MRTIRMMFLGLLLTATVMGASTDFATADTLAHVQAVQAGQTATYQIEIANDASGQHTYKLATSGLPATLKITFAEDGPVVDAVTVGAGKKGRFALRAEVPADTAVGRYAGAVTATRDDGVVVTTPLILEVENTYSLKVVSMSRTIATFSGQEFAFDVSASNTGAAPITNVGVKMDAPGKWIVQSDPKVVASFEPGAETVFHVKVLVPSSQAAIDQPVSLTVAGDQATGPPESIAVRVQTNPSYLPIAGAVVVLALVGVVLYFRIKGRR
jgi:uncharacterized membrane protein